MLTCSIPYDVTSKSIICDGVLLQSQLLSSSDNYVYCNEPFALTTSGYIECQSYATAVSDTSTIPASAYLFSVDSYSHSSNGKIGSTVNLSSTAYLETTAQPLNQSSYELNTDLMNILHTELFYIFGFGIFFGAIIGMIRKSAQK